MKAKLRDRGKPRMCLGRAIDHSVESSRLLNVETMRVMTSRDTIWLNKVHGAWKGLLKPTKDETITMLPVEGLEDSEGSYVFYDLMCCEICQNLESRFVNFLCFIYCSDSKFLVNDAAHHACTTMTMKKQGYTFDALSKTKDTCCFLLLSSHDQRTIGMSTHDGAPAKVAVGRQTNVSAD